MPATDVVETFHWETPKTRANVSWKAGLDTVTWTERSGSHDLQLAADGSGVITDAVNGRPANVQLDRAPTSVQLAGAPSWPSSEAIACARAASYWVGVTARDPGTCRSCAPASAAASDDVRYQRLAE